MTDVQLPPLPEPDWSETRPTNPPRHGQHWYGEAKIQGYASAAVLAERERIAAMLDRDWLCDTVEEREHRAECAAAIRKGGVRWN